MPESVSAQVPRRRRLTSRTIAAVPMTATVAPAAVIVASFLSSRRPATAWCPPRCSSRTCSAVSLSNAGFHPLLHLFLLQPPVAADRELAGDLAGRGQLQRGNQVIDMAELPARRAALDGQQPRRLEVAGDQGVHTLADQRGGADDRDGHAGVGLRGALRQVLDLQQVPDHAAVRVGAQRCILGQRDRVVRPRTVHHRAGHQHDPAYPPRGRRGQHGLRTADVERPPGPLVGVGGQVEVGVHDHVHSGQPAGQGRITDVDHPPGHAGRIAPVPVDGDEPADPGRRRQPGGERVAEAAGRPGDGHHRAAPALFPFPGVRAAVRGRPVARLAAAHHASMA